MSQSCPNCGAQNDDSYRFCASCGAALKRDPQATMPVTPPPSTDSVPPYAPPSGASAYSSTSQYPPVPPAPPAYVVKTTPDASSNDPQAPTMPMNMYSTASTGVEYPSRPATSADLGQAPGSYTGYQGNAQPASVRKDGGVYVPYSDGALAALEPPASGRSRPWLVPVIVVAAVLLLGLGAVTGFLLVRKPADSSGTSGVQLPPANTAPGVGTTTVPGAAVTPGSTVVTGGATGPDADQIKTVIRKSNDQQIQAWKDLNSDILKETYTGKALQENIDMVNQLKTHNMYAIPVNQRLDILDVQVNGDTATAKTFEVWTVTFYSKADNKKGDSRGPDRLNETYHLVKKDGKWMIQSLDIDNGVATPTPATGY